MLGDLLTGPNIVQGGAAGVLVIVVLLILTGRIVPHRSVADRERDWNARLDDARREAAQWRSAANSATQATADLAAQMNQLLEAAHTTERFIAAIQPREGAS